ncbi:putative ABC transport system permease protein [Kroppenstedtia sanguinis]|uniref:ABC transporter permease n=1 Tax=Kroppenstedtia sanguinis TaxID=1380684 RepID=UPI003D1E36CF
MTFRQFAFNNVRRNFRSYSAYFLSSAFAVMIFFVYAVFIFHPELDESELKASVVKGMTAAEVIIFVFSFLFVWYSVSAFLKVRKKEFGVLTLLGMSRSQLNRMVFLENWIIGLASIGTGILAGLLFSKGFLMIGARVLGIEELSFYFPVKGLLLTLVSFLILFLVISMFTVFMVRNQRVIELLQGSQKPKKEPKPSILLSLLAAACLIGGYGLALTSDTFTSEEIMFSVIGLVIVGTYFLYTQLSVFLIRRLKKNRGFYWRGTRLMWLSDLTYRMKDNARMFFLVTIVFTVSFTATGTLINFYDQIMQTMNQTTPFSISYKMEEKGFEGISPESGQNIIEGELKKEDVSYRKWKAEYLNLGPDNMEQFVNAIKLSDYNRLAKIVKQPARTLKPGEVLAFDTRPDQFQADDRIGQELQLMKKPYKVAASIDQPIMFRGSVEIVVPDPAFAQLKKAAQETGPDEPHVESGTFAGYSVPKWDASFPHPQGNQIGETLKEKLKMPDVSWPGFTARDAAFTEVKQGLGATLFVGLFVAVVFLICAGSFLYFRLYTDQDRDRQHYRAISRIGLTEKEMNRSVTVQIALLFFIPFVVAVIHTSVALGALQNMMMMKSILIPSAWTIGSFLVLQLVYFIIARRSYLRNLKVW